MATDHLPLIKSYLLGLYLDALACRKLWLNEHSWFLVLQNSSPRFSKFLELLPTVFVGTSRMLQQLVPMICDEMSRCFASLGQPVPPWRRIQTVKSRWTCTKPTIPKFVQESTNFRIQSVHQDQTEIRKPPSMLHYQLLMGSKKALPQHTKGHKKSRFSVLYEQNGLIFPHVAKKDIYTMIHRKNEAKGRKMHECKRVTITEAVIAHLNNGWFGVAWAMEWWKPDMWWQAWWLPTLDDRFLITSKVDWPIFRGSADTQSIPGNSTTDELVVWFWWKLQQHDKSQLI